MAASRHRPFPLVARRRLHALTNGSLPSMLRGAGSETIGTRPYRPGDRLGAIDWRASARLATATASDTFVVREHRADVAPRGVVVTDRRPSVAAPGPPWLSKTVVLVEAADAIATSFAAAHGSVGYLEAERGGIRWRPPRPRATPPRRNERLDGPPDALERSLAYLRLARIEAPAGTFVFVCSDFLPEPPASLWRRALAQGWDVVPVVVQDATWERSFPDVGGMLLPVADPATGRVEGVRVGRRRARELRSEHERRFERLLAEFASLRLDPVVLAAAEPHAVDLAFHAWAARRRASLRSRR
jgi:uncharacterized protein (DUF58 family)